MKSKTLFFALVIAITAVLTAWQISTPAQAADSSTVVTISTTIKADGSGDNSWEVNGKLLEQAGSSMTIEEVCSSAVADTFSTHRVENRSGVKWCILKGSFSNIDQLTGDFYSQLSPAVNRLEIRDKTLYYDLDIDPNMGSTNLSVEWKVVAPGKVASHNADKVSGCTLSWKLESTGSQNVKLESKTDGKCGGAALIGNTWLIVGIVAVCCCLLLMVIVVVVVFFVMRKKKSR
jgi:hypothetical protein